MSDLRALRERTTCPVCGMEAGQPYAGMPECRQSFSGTPASVTRYIDSLRRQGCLALIEAKLSEADNGE